MICYADIESTAIPSTGVLGVEKIHCIAIKSENNPTLCYTSHFLPISNYGGTLKAALDEINRHDTVVFHNYTFDIPVIENLLGPVTAKPLDSMLVAKLLYTKDELTELDMTIENFPSKKYGSFSLEAFGHRIGLHKGDYNDWSRLTVAMTEYCTNDVEVTYQLIQNMLDHPNYPNENVLELEHRVRWIVSQQEYYGFYFDLENARELYSKMLYEQTSIRHRLLKTFKPKYLPDGPVDCPSGTTRSKKYIPNPDFQIWNATDYFPIQYQKYKNGSIKLPAKTKYKYFTEPMKLYYSVNVGERQKIKLTSFDPNSRHKIKHWLKQDYDFEFSSYTEKFNTKVDVDELASLGEYGKDLVRYLKLTKDMSQLYNPKTKNGLIDSCREHSHAIHGRVDTIGAATHRATHSSPNLAQIPADGVFRSLFTAPSDMIVVGADLANIELRVLAHYLYPYDGGKYAEAVQSKDMHWYHTGLAGFYPTEGVEYDEHNPEHKAARNKAKAFVFGWIYGQGSTRRGDILWTDNCLPSYTQMEYDQAKERVEARIVYHEGIPYFPIEKDRYVEYNDLLIQKTIYGEQVANTFLERVEGISELIAACQKQSKDTGYIEAIDGRLLYSRSPHSALNLLLQGTAAIVAKKWMVNYVDLAYENGLEFGEDYWQSAYVHDEYQCPAKKSKAKDLCFCLEEGASKVTTDYNFNLPIRADAQIGQSWADTH